MSNNANSVPSFTPAERVLILRKMVAKMTRQEFSDHTGIRYHQLESIERGKQKVNDEVYEKIGAIWPGYIPWLVMEAYDYPSPELQASIDAEISEIKNKYGLIETPDTGTDPDDHTKPLDDDD